MTEIFNNGFDSGDFSAWTSTDYAGTAPTVQSAAKHHGTYAMKSALTNAGNYGVALKSITATAAAYVRSYVYVSALPASGNRLLAGTGFIDNTSGGGYDNPSIYIYNDAGTMKWSVNYTDSGGYKWADSAGTTIVANTWYCVEVYRKMSTTIGEVRLFVDGTEKITVTGLADNSGVTLAMVQAGGYSPVALSTNVYVDCVVAADAYIGPESGTTLKSVSDSLAISDIAVRHKSILPLIDVVGLGDSMLRNKAFVLLEYVGALDSAKGNKNPLFVSDTVDLDDIANVIAGAILKAVGDTAGLMDAVLLDKGVSASEVISVFDLVFRDKSSVTIADAVSVVEIVEVGVAGAKKTKLFLVLGGLALQLTGDS